MTKIYLLKILKKKMKNLYIKGSLIEKLNTLKPINLNDIQIIKIKLNGDCFYRCVILLSNRKLKQSYKCKGINYIMDRKQLFYISGNKQA